MTEYDEVRCQTVRHAAEELLTKLSAWVANRKPPEWWDQVNYLSFALAAADSDKDANHDG